MTFLVHINEYRYAVDGAAIADVQARILKAVQAGGEFVDFCVAGGTPVKVLVTPASAVRIEQLPPTAEPLDGDDQLSDFSFFPDMDLLLA
ncbi:hypothetical protein D6T64_01185 [Cryobacterium melibiosiphilum]|uniref:Uncharacterized protein n=1 Tax=Cryobacterium melibiosiphilum TaxID=995039 RepID=A0A3A5MX02_9MICO|nr:hypothetical protein [Cryobacterium melibiosiphilum]RJT91768.1 hypothetical protein D6T64_01185 [Cryobacterium melibiosiphilum]